MNVAVKHMSVAEYLAWADARPERAHTAFVDGKVVLMAPERNRHNLVKTNAAVVDEGTTIEPDAVVPSGAALDPDAVTVEAPWSWSR